MKSIPTWWNIQDEKGDISKVFHRLSPMFLKAIDKLFRQFSVVN
jgi:hypothetical protein